MELVSITVVKNEVDIIESFVRYHVNIFDKMIILNNDSTDGTDHIIKKLIEEGLPIFLLSNNEYLNVINCFNLLLKKAFNEFNADIVSILDADEFIISNQDNPRNIINNIDKSVYHKVKRRTYVPTVYDNSDNFIPSRITFSRNQNLEFIHKIILTKELFDKFDVELIMDNHNLCLINSLYKEIDFTNNLDLNIAHFPLRSINQSIDKILKIYLDLYSKNKINSELFEFYQKKLSKMSDFCEINIDDITDFAKRFALIDNNRYLSFENENIKLFQNPINFDFCDDLSIKYDYNLFSFSNILENYLYLLNEINNLNIIDYGYYNNFMEILSDIPEVYKKKIFDDFNNIIQLSYNIKHVDLNLKYNINKLKIIAKIIKKDYSNLTIIIKTPNPVSDKRWGDYFYALSLKKSFQKFGFKVKIHEREYWDCDEGDIVIVLRGLVEYNTKHQHLNLMWNISHPDSISDEEYEKFDIVFIASNKFANVLSDKLDTLVKPLLQCTDPDVFYPCSDNEFDDKILFVGITRGVFRQIIKDLTKTDHEFSVYGSGWEKFIDKKYIKGEFINNDILHKAYSSCKILLNDHWEDMAENGFISNRIFDALACKTFIISDNVYSVDEILEGNIVTYVNHEDLDKKIDYYLMHDQERELIAQRGYDIVLKNHTFDNRVSEILSTIIFDYFNEFIMEWNNYLNSS